VASSEQGSQFFLAVLALQWQDVAVLGMDSGFGHGTQSSGPAELARVDQQRSDSIETGS
jgi:hypothetical protein